MNADRAQHVRSSSECFQNVPDEAITIVVMTLFGCRNVYHKTVVLEKYIRELYTRCITEYEHVLIRNITIFC